jgi:hypothetical protein
VLHAEPLQRVRCEVLHRGRAAVVAGEAAVRVAQRAEFDAYERLFAQRGRGGAQRLADQHLVVAHAVEVAGVQQRDARFEGGVDRRDGLGAVGVAVQPGHAHTAEAEGGDLGAGRAEGAGVH